MIIGPVWKYSTEVALEFVSIDRFLYRVTDLLESRSAGPHFELDPDFQKDLLERLDDCHLYIIGTRPRLSVVPGTVQWTDTLLTFQVEFNINGAGVRSEWEVGRELLFKEERSFDVSDYPHREIIGCDVSGHVITRTVLASSAHLIPSAPQHAKDLEVSYVGKGLRKSAQDRLRHHETVQRILANVSSNQPDHEVFALVYAFESRLPVWKFAGVPVEIIGAPARRRLMALGNLPNLDDQIALAEASCIAYFQPVYNDHYLDFPKKTHRIVRQIKEADYTAIIVNLDQDPIGGLRTFSRSVAAASFHHIVVDFRTLEGKPSVFHATESESLLRGADHDETNLRTPDC